LEKIRIGDELADNFSESLETVKGLKILRFFNADPDPGSGIFFTLDPGFGMEDSDPRSGINIPDPQHCQKE
jgi:hypothetical protein